MNRTDFEQAKERYLSAVRSMQKSEQTLRNYTGVLNGFGKFLNGWNGEELDGMTVIDYRKWLYDSGISVNSIAHYLVILSAFFGWCSRFHLIEKNIVESAEIPKQKGIEYDLLSMDEIEKVLSYKPRKSAKREVRNHAIAVLLIMTGLRNAEIRSLRVGDLDFENGMIIVRHGKGDKFRNIPFPDHARSCVSEYLHSENLSDQDFLFGTTADENGHLYRTAERHKMTGAALLSMINHHTEKVCGHKVGVHSLRHAYASMCDHYSVPIRQIQLSMGHARYDTTMRVYISVLEEDKVAKSINAAFNKEY